MKRVFIGLVFTIFLTQSISAQTTTLTFDDQGWAHATNVGNPTVGGFDISSNGTGPVSGLQHRTNGSFCPGYNDSHLIFNGTTPNTVVIKTTNGSEFDFESIDILNDFRCLGVFPMNITITGYKDGAAVSGATATSPASELTTTIDVSTDADFSSVDEIRIKGALTGGGLDNFSYSPAAAADPVVTLMVSDNNPSEGAGSVTLTATADVAPSADLTVNLSYSGTATGGGTDYTAVSSIVISSGTTSNTGTLNITSDSDVENDETIIIDISSLTGVTATEGSPNQQTVTIANDDYAFSLKVFLEGPLSGSSMSTSLNASLPTNPSTIYASALSETSSGIPGTAVDWVEVELRTGTAAGTKVGTNRAAILKSDGSLVDKDGNAFNMSQADGTSYFIVIHHRNHLSVMSNAVVAHSSGTYTFDFTTAQANNYNNGSDGAIQVGSVFAMYAGDADDSGTVDGTDLTTWRAQNGVAFTYASNGKSDLNMDGVINAVDRNGFQQKNLTITTQVPSS